MELTGQKRGCREGRGGKGGKRVSYYIRRCKMEEGRWKSTSM